MNLTAMIYLVTCNKCISQYVGNTVDEFHLRWNNKKMNDINFLKGQLCMQQQLFEHLSSESLCSFLEEVTVTFIDKTDPKDSRRREHYWRHTLKT